MPIYLPLWGEDTDTYFENARHVEMFVLIDGLLLSGETNQKGTFREEACILLKNRRLTSCRREWSCLPVFNKDDVRTGNDCADGRFCRCTWTICDDGGHFELLVRGLADAKVEKKWEMTNRGVFRM